MSQVIRVWSDLLCSCCYLVLSKEFPVEKYEGPDEPIHCDSCDDWVFPIVVMKREYDTSLAPKLDAMRMEKEVPHGVEILHIDGEGIHMLIEEE